MFDGILTVYAWVFVPKIGDTEVSGMLARRRWNVADDPYYDRDPYVHPELAWPEDAPITAEEFVKIRASEPEPRDGHQWSYAYVLDHYPHRVLYWAEQMSKELWRQSRSLKYPKKRQPPSEPDALPTLETIARELAHNPRALEKYIEEDRQWHAREAWRRRRTSPWRRAWWAAVLTVLMGWWFILLVSWESITSPVPVHHARPNPTMVEAGVFLFVVISVGTWALYFWRSKHWQWTDDKWAVLYWAKALLFGGVAGALMWWGTYHAFHYPVGLAWQATIAFGAWVAVLVRRIGQSIDLSTIGEGLLLGLMAAPFLLLFLL